MQSALLPLFVLRGSCVTSDTAEATVDGRKGRSQWPRVRIADKHEACHVVATAVFGAAQRVSIPVNPRCRQSVNVVARHLMIAETLSSGIKRVRLRNALLTTGFIGPLSPARGSRYRSTPLSIRRPSSGSTRAGHWPSSRGALLASQFREIFVSTCWTPSKSGAISDASRLRRTFDIPEDIREPVVLV